METLQQATRVQEMAHALKVGDVMTRKLVTVHPSALVRELREPLRANRISGLPVVDGRKLVGIISLEDFIKCLADGESGCRVEEKMTREVAVLHFDDPLTTAVGKFETSRLGRFPVVDRQSGELVGIVTKGDVIAGLLKKIETDFHRQEALRHRARRFLDAVDADEATLAFEYVVKGGDFERAGGGSSRLKRTLLRLGLDPSLARRVAIASYEAEMNLVIFTQGGTLGLSARPPRLTLEVRDSGPGIEDVQKALQPGFSTASDWVRELGFGAGMGLPNIRNMSDELNIESAVGRGTTLEIIFHIDEAENESD